MQTPSTNLLPAPSVRQAGACILDAHVACATVIVPVYPGKAADDRIALRWGEGATVWTYGLTVWERTAGQPSEVEVSQEFLAANRGRILDLVYSVTSTDGRIRRSRKRSILLSRVNQPAEVG